MAILENPNLSTDFAPKSTDRQTSRQQISFSGTPYFTPVFLFETEQNA
jgi:hypothetical protein